MITEPSPLVDQVLTDSLAIPPGVDRWLREAERTARRLRRELQSVAAEGSQRIALLDQVLEEIIEFLDDEQKSPFRRLLRRPLAQVGPGSPAARSFDGYTGRLFQQGRAVLEAQSVAAEAAERLRELTEKFAGRMPYFTATTLARLRIEPGEPARIRRASDARSLLRRIRRADDALERLARHLPQETAGDRMFDLDGGRRVGAAELWSALQLRLRGRGSAPTRVGWAATLRRLQAAHVRQLGQTVGGHLGGSDGDSARTLDRGGAADRPEHTLAEHLADRSLRAGSSGHGAHAIHDTGLWAAILGAADRARFPASDDMYWRPRIASPGLDRATAADLEATGGDNAAPRRDPASSSAESARRSETTSALPESTAVAREQTALYVVPIIDDFFYISNEYPSPVRLWSLAAREGEVVDATVFGGREPILAERLEEDVRPLFDGADSAGSNETGSGWYATETRATLTVLGAYRSGWFATRRGRGVLRRMRAPAFMAPEKSTSALRVFDRTGAATRDRSATVGSSGLAPHGFLGVDAHEVRTSIAGHEIAWLRAANGAPVEALEREHSLIREMRLRAPGLVMFPLGRGRLMPEGPEGFLYAPPLGVGPGSPLAAEWLGSSARATIGALLRTVRQVHEAGFALGVHHVEMYVFGMDRAPDAGGGLRPRAILAGAPHATPFGRYFDSPSALQLKYPPTYPRLGFRGFPMALSMGETALPSVDAVGLALVCLEILLDRPLPRADGNPTSWTGLAAALREHAALFPDKAWAAEVARLISSGGGGDGELMALLAAQAG